MPALVNKRVRVVHSTLRIVGVQLLGPSLNPFEVSGYERSVFRFNAQGMAISVGVPDTDEVSGRHAWLTKISEDVFGCALEAAPEALLKAPHELLDGVSHSSILAGSDLSGRLQATVGLSPASQGSDIMGHASDFLSWARNVGQGENVRPTDCQSSITQVCQSIGPGPAGRSIAGSLEPPMARSIAPVTLFLISAGSRAW